MRKKSSIVVLSLLCALSLAACNTKSTDVKSKDETKQEEVVTKKGTDSTDEEETTKKSKEKTSKEEKTTKEDKTEKTTKSSGKTDNKVAGKYTAQLPIEELVDNDVMTEFFPGFTVDVKLNLSADGTGSLEFDAADFTKKIKAELEKNYKDIVMKLLEEQGYSKEVIEQALPQLGYSSLDEYLEAQKSTLLSTFSDSLDEKELENSKQDFTWKMDGDKVVCTKAGADDDLILRTTSSGSLELTPEDNPQSNVVNKVTFKKSK